MWSWKIQAADQDVSIPEAIDRRPSRSGNRNRSLTSVVACCCSWFTEGSREAKRYRKTPSDLASAFELSSCSASLMAEALPAEAGKPEEAGGLKISLSRAFSRCRN